MGGRNGLVLFDDGLCGYCVDLRSSRPVDIAVVGS